MIITGNKKKVVILAFNVGRSGELVNGPGISLRNLLFFLKTFYPKVSISIFTSYSVTDRVAGVRYFKINDSDSLRLEIKASDVVHCWSGLRDRFLEGVCLANKEGRPVILGPNLIDGVEYTAEQRFLDKINFDLLLTANPRLRYFLTKIHGLNFSKTDSFMVGPDLDLWTPPSKVGEYILWKGNGRNPVKDVRFAKRVSQNSRMQKYRFVFLGDEKRFDYKNCIGIASQARLYINTSLSETKGMAQLEQMAAGVPSVTHPKVYCHGENYVTGIVTNKTVDDYADAIEEIMEDNKLRKDLMAGSRSYIEENFLPQDIASKYMEILENVS